MKLTDGVEWGVHACTVLAVLPPDEALPAARLAEFHGVPGAYMAKHLQALARDGILETVKGRSGGYRLARPAREITLLDIVEAIDGPESAFQCTEIRRRGPSAVPARDYRLPCGVARAFARADDVRRAELRETTVESLVISVATEAPPAALVKGGEWLAGAMRR